jgi:uncharacterized protein YgiB involved in biofilm formation
MKSLHLALVCLVPLALAGCGGSAPKPAAKAATIVGVFTSAQDCAEGHHITATECDTLIQGAIKVHQATSRTYISRRLCEEAEGADHCERSETNAFRPKLLAFQVTFSTPPTAIPLYAPADRTIVGFTTMDKAKTLKAIDETLVFSQEAKIVAEGNVGG